MERIGETFREEEEVVAAEVAAAVAAAAVDTSRGLIATDGERH